MLEFIQAEIDKLEQVKVRALADFHQAVGALAAYRNIRTGMEKIDGEEAAIKAETEAVPVPAQKEITNPINQMQMLNPGIGQLYNGRIHDEAIPVI